MQRKTFVGIGEGDATHQKFNLRQIICWKMSKIHLTMKKKISFYSMLSHISNASFLGNRSLICDVLNE